MTEEIEFKKNMKEYLLANNKLVTDDILEQKWKENCSVETETEDKNLLSKSKRPEINITVSNILRKIKELRQLKKDNPAEFKDIAELRYQTKLLYETRKEKKRLIYIKNNKEQ